MHIRTWDKFTQIFTKFSNTYREKDVNQADMRFLHHIRECNTTTLWRRRFGGISKPQNTRLGDKTRLDVSAVKHEMNSRVLCSQEKNSRMFALIECSSLALEVELNNRFVRKMCKQFGATVELVKCTGTREEIWGSPKILRRVLIYFLGIVDVSSRREILRNSTVCEK